MSLSTKIARLVLAAVALVACGGGNHRGRPGSGTGDAGVAAGAIVTLATTIPGPRATIGPAGGVIDGEAGTPLEGVHIDVPSGAFAVDTVVTLGRNSGTVTPAAGTWGGLIIDLTTDYGQEFDAAIAITLRFGGASREVPIPFYINPTGRLEYIDPVNVDRQKRTFTFQTWHASPFTFIVARFDDPLAPSYNTGFDSAEHGFRIRNAGSLYNHSGECLGMAAWAGWFYINQTLAESRGNFYDQYMAPVGDLTGQAIIATRAYDSINQAWEVYLPALKWQIETLTPEEEWVVIRYAMMNQAAPVIITLTTPLLGSDAEGHAVLASSFVGDQLFIYDSNVVGTTETIHYNTTLKRFDDYSPFGWTKFATVGMGSHAQRESFGRILDDANTNFGNSVAAKIEVLNHNDGDHVSSRDLTLTGRISSVQVVVEQLTVNVGGSQIVTPVDPVTGDFSLHVPIKKGDNYLYLGTRGKNATSKWVTLPNSYTNTKGFHLVGDLETTTILATLTWDQPVDLDLYVTDPKGDTAWFSHKTTADGGQLDIDVTSGYGPEHFTLTTANTQHFGQPYLVKVHKFAAGEEFTHWTIKYSLNDGPSVIQTGTLTHGDPLNIDPGSTGADWGGFFEIVPQQP